MRYKRFGFNQTAFPIKSSQQLWKTRSVPFSAYHSEFKYADNANQQGKIVL